MRKYLQSLFPKKKNFILSPDEKVLLQMDPLRSESSKIAFTSPMSFVFFIFLGATIFCFVLAYKGPSGIYSMILTYDGFYSIIVWIIAGAVALMTIFLLVEIINQRYKKRQKRQTYYITDHRVVKKYPNNKYKEISYKDISYIFDGLTSLNIYSKGPDGELFYTGAETEYIQSTFGKPKLAFRLGLTNHFIMLDLLAKLIPLKLHPHLERIYIRDETKNKKK